uniref:Uncharacterized protein n=1 Tax=Alexandrium catenella TaxID=2925 RepID=A0A7S1S5Q6_ALECA
MDMTSSSESLAGAQASPLWQSTSSSALHGSEGKSDPSEQQITCVCAPEMSPEAVRVEGVWPGVLPDKLLSFKCGISSALVLLERLTITSKDSVVVGWSPAESTELRRAN